MMVALPGTRFTKIFKINLEKFPDKKFSKNALSRINLPFLNNLINVFLKKSFYSVLAKVGVFKLQGHVRDNRRPITFNWCGG